MLMLSGKHHHELFCTFCTLIKFSHDACFGFGLLLPLHTIFEQIILITTWSLLVIIYSLTAGFGNCNKQLLLSKFDRFPTDLQDKPHDMLPKTWSCQGQILTPGRCLLHMSLLSFLLYCNCQEKLSFGISVVI